MNNIETKYVVIGTWGAKNHETELGTYETLTEAETRADTLSEDKIYEYSHFHEVRIEKHSSIIVHRVKDIPNPSSPDYERQGVIESFGVSDDLHEWIRQLEDRHVGLRHDLMSDMDFLHEKFETLRNDVNKELKELRVDVVHDIMNTDSDVRALENEVETLRDDVASVQGQLTNFEQETGKEIHGLRREIENLHAMILKNDRPVNRHEEWERQQEKNKQVTEFPKGRGA